MRIIKKYANRRLYDTELSRYITLDDIKSLILNETEFKIIAAKGEEDLTCQVITQVLIEQENPILTSFILKQLIRMYHNDKHGFLSKFLEESITWFCNEHKKYIAPSKASEDNSDFLKKWTELNLKQWESWQDLMQSFLYPTMKKDA